MFSHVPRRARLLIPALIASSVLGATRLVAPADGEPIIRRTEYGVPHISANDFRGIGIGLGYAQAEDYGVRVILSLIRSKGWMGRTFGRDSLSSDFSAALEHARVEQTYHLLDADTRDMYDGFAEGVNRYIRANAKTLPTWAKPVFHGHDVAAGDIGTANVATAERLVVRWLQRSAGGAARPTARDTGNLDVDPAAIFGADADVGP